MKKSFIISLFIFILMIYGGYVEAATFKITASTKNVNPDGTFSISVGGDCIGRVNLSVTNGTLSNSSVWVEQNYQTVNVKAGSSGVVTITATPVAGFSDADANEYKPGAKSVRVTINNTNNSNQPNTDVNNNNSNNNNNTSTPSAKPNTKPSTNQPEKKPQTIIEEKSSNNLLATLTTNIGTLEPNFDTNIGEYAIKLKEEQPILISAVSQDSKAKVNGGGEINLGFGENVITITVIAENGEERIYTIKAYVDDTPQVYLKYKEKEIGVVRNLKEVTIPEGFQKKQHTVNEYSISVFNNEKFSIICGIDTEGNKNFYTIDTENNECINKIIPITINKHSFFLGDWQEEKEGFEFSTITIQGKEIKGYKFKEGFSDYFLLSAMNNNGEIVEYLYEMKEGTLQLYLDSAPINYSQYKELIKEVENKQIIIYVLVSILILSAICYIFLFWKLRKGKLNEEIH